MNETHGKDKISGISETHDLMDRMRMDRMRIENTVWAETNTTTSADSEHSSSPNESDHEIQAGMPAEARRTLVFLLRQGVVLASRKSKVFEAVCRYETHIRRHLSDVYLNLVLDDKAGVAFIAGMQSEHQQKVDAQVDAADEQDEEEFSSLISRRVLPLYETLLLLVLRKYYQSRELCGEQKIIVDIEKIESDLSVFLPLSNSERTDRKKLNGALKRMVDSKILSVVRGSTDRFEITPIIRYVVSAEFLESMLKEYERLANEAGQHQDQAACDAEDV